VIEYLVDANATRAAIRAGYSPRGAEVQGHRLLRNAKVAAAIRVGQAEQAGRAQVTAERVRQELARIAFADLRDYATWGPEGLRLNASNALGRDQSAAIVRVHEARHRGDRSVTVRLHGKLAALNALAKVLGLFDQRQVTTSI